MREFSQYIFIIFSIFFSIGIIMYNFMCLDEKLDGIQDSIDVIAQCHEFQYSKGDEN